MAPSAIIRPGRSSVVRRYLEGEPGSWRKNATEDAFILESWGQGFIVGALLIMALITISNMKRGILLHKLIFIELILALSHGTFCFMSFKGYGWYLSATAGLLYLSTLVHNVVAWLKIRPFLTRRGSIIFIGSFIMTIPPVLFQSINNFLFFNNISDLYTRVRPYEALMRDPWWMFSCFLFFYVIKTRYTVTFRSLMTGQPRFAIMITSMMFSFIFSFTDALVSAVPSLSKVNGVNPYWKLALVFKALTDTIILDDFKTCLDRLRTRMFDSQGDSLPGPGSHSQKEYAPKERPATIITPTAENSSHVVTTQTPKPPGTVRRAMSRVGTHLSPLQPAYQMRPDIHPYELSPKPVIHIKTDFSLDKFAKNGARSASVPE
ncbi:hypothetical protein EPUS_01584 [Endocarpon pusillum Z07020]|uniref:Uncharacterized protein n=1 Tax=Endocarpon pusillum (strain Z07020 / HMAS-L-300199) TaxID=1263415 RepID=U1I1G8_ENDPU|nr:uncharacterized protein EPUS_01584 [Endocarpon pusillum Z07020]ERF75754.1 hypothetical protein EPUS_01584 [Endocarpon pusillum Z07020]